MERFKKEPRSVDGFYYLLSTRAINSWKEFLDYPNIVADKKPNISLSRKPQKVNEDLKSIDKIYLDYPEKQHPCAVICKPDVVDKKDYIIVNHELWKFFNKKYPGIEIKRKGAVSETGQVTLVKDMHVV